MDNSERPAPEQELPEVYKKLLNDPNASFLDKYGKYFLLFSLIFIIVVFGIKYVSSNYKQKQLAILQPTTSPNSFSASPTSDPSKMKTYINNRYSFAFQYPQQIDKIEEKDTKIILYYQNGTPAIGITVSDDPKSFINFLAYPECSSSQIVKKCINGNRSGQIILGGVPGKGFELVEINGESSDIIKTNMEPLIELQIQYYDENASRVFGQIISTFKFLDQAQVSIPPPTQKLTFCTEDARQCPDGSFVGRTGPNCEFVCPASPGE